MTDAQARDPAPAACPFCERIGQGLVDARSGLAASFADAYPVTDGHTLVVPVRHEADFFALTDAERADIWDLVNDVQRALADAGTRACNVGINNGETAGQTIAHAHVHVIPRRAGDVDDPRGGVRWVIPDKAPYWDD